MDMARDLARALDPAMLMEQAGLPPDPWQREFLRSEAKRQLLLCSRQSGKSTVTATLALHTALYQAPCLILLLSRALRQSQERMILVEELTKARFTPVSPRCMVKGKLVPRGDQVSKGKFGGFVKSMFPLVVFLLAAAVAGAQPFSIPQDGPGSSVTTSDAHGRRYETVQTPSGGVETIGPQGEIYQTVPTPSGGSVTYGPQGERWETVPGPATPPPRAQEGQ